MIRGTGLRKDHARKESMMADTTARPSLTAPHRARLARAADWLAVGVAVAMPWSISISQILTVAWLVALVPTLDVAIDAARAAEPGRRAAGRCSGCWRSPECSGPNVPWSERLAGFEGFHKLLVIPLLLAQFRRSERGIYVVYGFFASCTALLLASWGLMALWKCCSVYVPGKIPGLLVKDYIAQSTEFLICASALLGVCGRSLARAAPQACGRSGAAGGFFLGNIFYIAPGRTALVVLAAAADHFRLPLFWLEGRPRRMSRGCRARRCRVDGIAVPARARDGEYRRKCAPIETGNAISSSGIRLEIWKKSLAFIADGAGARPWHRLDPGAIPPRGGGRGRLGPAGDTSAQSDLRGRDPAWLPRHGDPDDDVDRASRAVSRRRADRVDRHRDRGAEPRLGAVQLAPVRFLPRLALRVRLRRGRRNARCASGEPRGKSRRHDRARRTAAHPGRRAAPARRRAAHHAADPQPQARMAGWRDRRAGVPRHRRHPRRQSRHRRSHHHAGAAGSGRKPRAAAPAMAPLRSRALDPERRPADAVCLGARAAAASGLSTPEA